jgi:hypothetical protein
MYLYVRELTDQESRVLSRWLRQSKSVVRMRRAQVIAFSAQGLRVQEVARQLRMHEEYVRELIRRFNDEGFGAEPPIEELTACATSSPPTTCTTTSSGCTTSHASKRAKHWHSYSPSGGDTPTGAGFSKSKSQYELFNGALGSVRVRVRRPHARR